VFNPRLWLNGAFTRFFIGATFSLIGNWFNNVAIAVLAYRISGQVSLAAVAIACSVLPRTILGPLAGILADRFERRNLLIALDAGRAFVALVPLFAHDTSTLWLVYATVLLLQTGACLYNPTQGAYLPSLVADDLLEPANATLASMRDIGLFAGPALAAVLLGTEGPSIAFWVNALSFAVSAALLLTLPRVAHHAVKSFKLRDLLVGYILIVQRYPRIGALYLCYIASAVPVFLLQGVMVAYVGVLGQPSTFIGALYAAAGLGGAVGGIATGHYLRRLPYAVAVAAFAVSVLLLGALALTTIAALALLLIACSTAAGTAGDVLFTVGVQRSVLPQERGRAFGLYFWSIAIGQLVGAVLGIGLARVAVTAIFWTSLLVLPIIVVGVVVSIRAGEPASATEVGVAAG